MKAPSRSQAVLMVRTPSCMPEGIGALRPNDSSKLLKATTHSLDDDTGDLVRVGVRGRATVLEVALAVLGDLAGDTDGAATVSDTI